MSDNGRITLIFFCNLLLYFIIGEFNFFLGSLSLHFHGDALLVLFFGLYLGRLGGLISATLLGFLADSANPVPYGTYVIGYLSLWLFFVWGQKRIRRQNHMHVRTLGAVAQLLWMFLLSLVIFSLDSSATVFWSRILFEMLFSTVLTFLLAWRWCQIQKNLLFSLGWNIEAEMSQI
jgi:cell shape-determining protein MreD